jgi:hypothetical protein
VNTFELELWDDERARCTFYTVKWQDVPDSETNRFFEAFENKPDFEEAINELLSFVLYAIGEDHGAIDDFFNREENQVTGLPSHGKVNIEEISYHYPNFPLRLYALRVTENIVILFNGGIKDGPTNQTSSLNMKWREACQLAKKITEALRSGDILIDEPNRKLTDHRGGDEIIL